MSWQSHNSASRRIQQCLSRLVCTLSKYQSRPLIQGNQTYGAGLDAVVFLGRDDPGKHSQAVYLRHPVLVKFAANFNPTVFRKQESYPNTHEQHPFFEN